MQGPGGGGGGGGGGGDCCGAFPGCFPRDASSSLGTASSPAPAFAPRSSALAARPVGAARLKASASSQPPAAASAMSDVRLSNGSPTLERMEARQADYPKPSACRNLFGPVDHGALARELQRHHRDLEEAGRRKWNFDFQRHRPLEGRYEWQAVGKDSLPEFYARPPRRGDAVSHAPLPPPSGGLDVNGNCPTAPRHRCSQGTAGEENAAAAALGADPKAAADGAPRDLTDHAIGQRKRPASDGLLDASLRNKRANTTEEAASEERPNGSPVEQTPKKCSPRQRQT